MLIGTIKIQQHQTPLANRINPPSPPASNPPRQPPAVESPAGFILPGGRQSGQAPAELRRRTVSQGEAGSSRFARARAGAAERRGRGSGGVPGPPEPQARPRRRFPGPRDSEPQCAERGPRGSPGAGGYLRTSRPRPHAGGWVGLGRPLSERQGVRAGPAARTPGPDRPAGGRRGGTRCPGRLLTGSGGDRLPRPSVRPLCPPHRGGPNPPRATASPRCPPGGGSSTRSEGWALWSSDPPPAAFARASPPVRAARSGEVRDPQGANAAPPKDTESSLRSDPGPWRI